MRNLGACLALALVASPAAAKVKKPVEQPVERQLAAPAFFDFEEATRNIRARMGAVRACYQRVSRREPHLEGKLQLGLDIGTAGLVSAARVEVDGLRAPDDPTASSELTACVRNLALSWKLVSATPEGGAHLSYVFVFKAAAN